MKTSLSPIRISIGFLDRAEKRANDNTDKNKLKGSILERKEKLDKLVENLQRSNE